MSKRNLDSEVLEKINIRKTVSLESLCKEFYISESTCRRVLKRLDDKGLISRYHGGANCIEKLHEHLEVNKRFYTNSDKKELVAAEAAKVIKPNDTIFLMGGSTVFRVCKHIKHIPLKVVTNSMLVFNELSNYENIELTLLGGTFNKEELEFRGFLTTAGLRLYACDYVFMGTDGYVNTAGFTTIDEGTIELYHWCIAMSKHSFLLTDSSKFFQRRKLIILTFDDVDNVITDCDIPKEEVENMKNRGVNVIVAEKT